MWDVRWEEMAARLRGPAQPTQSLSLVLGSGLLLTFRFP